MISEKAINEFKELWSKKYGYELSSDEALAKATVILQLFQAIYRQIKTEDLT